MKTPTFSLPTNDCAFSIKVRRMASYDINSKFFNKGPTTANTVISLVVNSNGTLEDVRKTTPIILVS